jgi:acetyl-CoA carboxylase carboxyl transferase subunit beta
MAWYQRNADNILTTTTERRETPEGVWHQCESCKHTGLVKDFIDNKYTCPQCNHHERIGSREYFDILFDENSYTVLFKNLESIDFLNFVDTKSYADRLDMARKKSGLHEATAVAAGTIESMKMVIAAMDFDFIGGSMGSVMGEKICRAIDHAIEIKAPVMVISQSGGARMMESTLSLMQMAKVSAKLTQLTAAKLPYFSLMTNPTTGGVSASFAMLGDVNIAEPKALIGFAGPRVIKETIRVTALPENFQTSESQLENGFIDNIIDRKNLRTELARLLRYWQHIAK